MTRETEVNALAREMRESSLWSLRQCEELCKLADMETEWNNATAEEFEAVVFKAAKKLGVEILQGRGTTEMKKKITYLIITAVISMAAFLVGKSMPDANRYLDMESVTDYVGTETGLILYTEDGSGYYWER